MVYALIHECTCAGVCAWVCIRGRKKGMIDLLEFTNKRMSLILYLSFHLLSKYVFFLFSHFAVQVTLFSHLFTLWVEGGSSTALRCIFFFWLAASLYQFQSLRGEYWLAKSGSNVSHCGFPNNARDAGLTASLSHSRLASEGRHSFSRQGPHSKCNRYSLSKSHLSDKEER